MEQWGIKDADAKRRDWQLQELGLAIHRLTANLLRIMADGGRVFDLQRQLDETNKLAKEVGGSMADTTMQDALELRRPWIEAAKTDSERRFNEEQSRISRIVQYSLRMAAAQLESNNSERSKNESLLCDTIRKYEEERKENNAQELQALNQRRRR